MLLLQLQYVATGLLIMPRKGFSSTVSPGIHQSWVPGFQVIKFCALVSNISGFSVWNVLHDTLLALRISRWLLYFPKICGPVGESIIVTQEMLVNHSQFSGLENILSYDMHSDGEVCSHTSYEILLSQNCCINSIYTIFAHDAAVGAAEMT
jgi:hypothetical protein